MGRNKKPVNITIEHDVHKLVKESGINLSEFVNEKLQQELFSEDEDLNNFKKLFITPIKKCGVCNSKDNIIVADYEIESKTFLKSKVQFGKLIPPRVNGTIQLYCLECLDKEIDLSEYGDNYEPTTYREAFDQLKNDDTCPVTLYTFDEFENFMLKQRILCRVP